MGRHRREERNGTSTTTKKRKELWLTQSKSNPLPPAPYALEYDAVDHRLFVSDNGGERAHAAQHVAFTACVNTHTLMMIDLQSMKLFGPWPLVLKPDILRLDLSLHRLYVPGSAGVSILDEQAAASGTIKKL